MSKFCLFAVLALLSGCTMRAQPEFVPSGHRASQISDAERVQAEMALHAIEVSEHTDSELPNASPAIARMEDRWVVLRWQFILLQFDCSDAELAELHRRLELIAAERRSQKSARLGSLQRKFEGARQEAARVLARHEQRLANSKLANFAKYLGSDLSERTMGRLAQQAYRSSYFRVLIWGPDRHIE